MHHISLRTKQYHVAAKYPLVQVEGARAFWMLPSSDNQRLFVLHGQRLCEVEIGETMTNETVTLLNTAVVQVEVGASGDDIWYLRARTNSPDADAESDQFAE